MSSVEYERLTLDLVGHGRVRLPGLWVAALGEAGNARTVVVKVPAVVGYGIMAASSTARCAAGRLAAWGRNGRSS